eukprot:TRINITY_DN23_c0_g1_i6.p2 TRINITY_DN23_c0_g1~~TRINITY_DN23_c0_g1_i6.p2  ORF type:complete len:332 (-),score=73.67 TRINITY_DN23_c0_g1_i6:378-1373(-)
MMKVVFLFALMGVAVSQDLNTLQIIAAGATPSGSAGQALGAGASSAGVPITGAATVDVSDKGSLSNVVVTAGNPPASPKPTPAPTPATPKPTPAATTPAKPAKKYMVKDNMEEEKAPKVVYVKGDKPKEPTCADVKDAKCADISKYEHCGFCVMEKYPTVGMGCEYSKVYVKKDGDKKAGAYETVLKPECECEGVFILEKKDCPSCETALEELVACANTDKSDVVEIPAECIKEVGVTVDFLKECGYLKEVERKEEKPVTKKYMKDDKEKEREPKVIVMKKEKEEKKDDPKTVIVKKPKSDSTTMAPAAVTATATKPNQKVTPQLLWLLRP